MIYTGDLVTIDGTTFDHLVTYKIGRSKLWKNSDRNMNGDVRATLIGIFPKIKMKINYTTQEEMSLITSKLDKDFFNVEWFDVRIQDTVTTQYYASDYEIELDSKEKGRYKPFEVNLVPVSKRRY
jgi:hypothetical protein